ncbi:putative transcription regulator bdf1 [Rosellinia necatrix]|uniref:Putative transcription regulator bdf1 n=1 Tax=Rosellinia necatrix TaxID=77044 RepID=A0A1W2TUS3_ROSNE|nr:putative transcription regulator bdf1 [Rosellinia necatrix]
MASEEPQRLPLESKTVDLTPVDEMEIDSSEPKTANVDVKSGTDSAQAEAAPATNGDATKSAQPSDDGTKASQNQQAFAKNNKLPDPASPKSDRDPLPTADTEMAEANEAADEKEKQPEGKADDNSTAPIPSDKALETVDEAEGEAMAMADESAEPIASPRDRNTDDPTHETNADSMDIDVATERPDLTSSAEHANSIQNTSAEGDAPVVSSPPGSSQPADLSKLEIKATREDENISPTQEDVPMTESVITPTKVPREREEDDAEEPAAKRAKTADADETTVESLVVAGNADADVSTQQASSESLGSAIPDNLPITPFQNKRIREVLGNVKKTKNGSNFRKSVQELWPGLWNDYAAKIDTPVDISLMEAKLREDKYANFGQFKADVNQLYENAVLFNGPQHDVTRAAAQVRDYILVRMPEIVQTETPAKPEKGKAQPTRHTEPRAATQPRRQSHPQTQAPVPSPKQKIDQAPAPTPAPNTAQAFAIPPSGIPQIRRDSTREDNDRPKRPIHPPKNRDPEYASKASRKKKLDPHQRFFDSVLDEIKKPKHYAINQWFLTAVDPVALNIPNYFKIIKKPMDLTTMSDKNYDGEYKTAKDLEKDMRHIVNNSEMFNGPEHDVTNQARQLEELLKAQLAGKEKWMERHYPTAVSSAMHASAASPERSMAESDDESEGDGEEEDNDGIQNLQQRLNEEQDKLNQLLNSKKPDLTMIEVQQSMVAVLQRKLVEERTKYHSEKKPKKKKGASSKSKSKTGGSTSLGGNKKLSGSVSTSKKPASSSKKPPPPKKRPIGALEKAVIADGINELDGSTLTKAVEIIKRDTGQNENDDGEMELDIDSLTVDALAKLYDLINKAHPLIRQGLAKKPEYSNTANLEAEPKPKPSGVTKAKKNKPMNKIEQERKIEQLRELKAQLQRHGSGSQEPIPEVEGPAAAVESSEESDSEEE